MKILRIIARLNVGGPARHVVWLTEALNDDEFESSLIAGSVPPGEEDMGYLAEKAGIEPVFIEEMSRELSVKDLISILKVYREIKRFRPDVIHTHTAKAGTVGRTAAFVYRWLTWKTLIGKPRKVRVVHTFHGHVFHSYYGRAKTRLFILIEKLLARLATDRIVAITEQQLKEINEEVGVGRRDQFRVIRLGIDLEPYLNAANERDSARKEFGIGEGELAVAFVGRLTEIKNIPLFLNAAKMVLQDAAGELPFRFFIAGDGHLRPHLEKMSADLGIAERIGFLGNLARPETVYAACDIVSLTSLNEGTPLSLIEGMAAGKPVISTVVGGVRDLVGPAVETRDGFSICERGVGVDSGDAAGLAKGLIYLAKNERLRERLSETGQNYVRAVYIKERLVREIKELYRSLHG
jgi:glycosyltransferase involved in cell wall biosynthesis